MEVMEVEKAPSANISPVGSSKRCLAGRPAKNIFQKYPPENFLRPPRCIGGAVSATPPPIPLTGQQVLQLVSS